MGWLSKCYETYQNCEHLVGQPQENGAILCPPGFMEQNVQLEVTIDADGHLIQAVPIDDKKDRCTIIPATEDSASRTRGVCAHPLCDQLGYLLPELSEKGKYECFVEGLRAWAESAYSHPIVDAVYKCVTGGAFYASLIEQIDLTQKIAGTEATKVMIRWRVRLADGSFAESRSDPGLVEAWNAYLSASAAETNGFCHVSGVRDVSITSKHPKNITVIATNAKLISANDTTNFVYRGRFATASEACQIGTDVSQKAHSALRWLIKRQGLIRGNRTFVCWNVGNAKVPAPYDPFEDESPAPETIGTEPLYRKKLAETLLGYRNALADAGNDIVMLSLEAATSGRLSVTYFNELSGGDYLERLEQWYGHFEWELLRNYGTSEKSDYKTVVGSPLLEEVVDFAFGTQQGNFVKADDRVKGQHLQTLIEAIADGGAFPTEILRALVTRCMYRSAYSPWNYDRLLRMTCAALKKTKWDNTREDISMELDETERDRSYLFGRLLAVLEKAEQLAQYRAGEQSRETNAERLYSAFVQHPMLTWKTLEQQLLPYYKRLGRGSEAFYRGEIEKIVVAFDKIDPDELNKPLTANYLLGYYLERKKLNTKKENENE